jgi:predicted Zn-dependent peptidase
MNVGTRLRAGLLGAFLVAATLPVRAATGDLPDLGPNVTVGRLPVGGTVIVRPTRGAPVAAIELWYRAPSTGFGTKPAPGIARLASQMVAASKPIIGDPLGKTVSDAGGRLGITVYGDSIAISAVVPAVSARAIIKAMTTAFFAPVATDDGFQEARREVEQEAQISNFDPETVARDAIFSQLFSAGPQHFPALGEPKDIALVSLADAKAFASRAFRSQNATLVVSGAVDPGVADAAVGGRSDDDASPEAATAPEIAAAPAPVTKNFAENVGGYGWIGPSIADTRDATAMDFIADYLFRPDDGYVTRQVADKYPDALLLGQFITLHDPGVMFVVYSGKDQTPALRALVDDGFAQVQKPMDPAAFASMLERFKYHLLSDLQTPTEMADNFGWYSVEGAPAYAPGVNGDGGAYFKAADSLTPEFVASVAQKYFAKAPATVTLRPMPALKEKAKPQ